MKRYDTGDGDYCPQDASHGRMWFVAPERQWCPNSRHVGSLIYLRDGVTSAAPQPAPGLAQGRTPASRAIGGSPA